MSSMSAIREYARLAPRYDRRYRAYLDRTHGEVLRHLGDCSGARILDAGCGTGLLLAAVSARAPAARLLGVDPSPEMLARARARLGAGAGLLQGRAEALPVASGRVDLVLSSSSLHYIAEPERALSEFARVLAGGGRLLLTDWCADSGPVRWMERFLHWRGRESHVMHGGEVVGLLEKTGFEVARCTRYSAGFPWTLYLCSARLPDR